VFKSRRDYEKYVELIVEARDLKEKDARIKQEMLGYVAFVKCNIRPDREEVRVMATDGSLLRIKVIEGPNAACVGVVDSYQFKPGTRPD
jgi:hypothetical protein